eukprot:SAG25_NODE_1609_length_2687_cov_1.034003_1_plen_31_part_10
MRCLKLAMQPVSDFIFFVMAVRYGQTKLSCS